MVEFECENCKNGHKGDYGSGRFCSTGCARGFSTKANRNEISKKVSETMKGMKGTNYCTGRKHSEKTRKLMSQKISEYHFKNKIRIKKEVPFENWPSRYIPEEMYIEYGKVCQECGLDWVDKDGKGPYEIHHIDGNKKNNKKENLKILCLNCHWKTPNYRFKGRKHKPDFNNKNF